MVGIFTYIPSREERGAVNRLDPVAHVLPPRAPHSRTRIIPRIFLRRRHLMVTDQPMKQFNTEAMPFESTPPSVLFVFRI